MVKNIYWFKITGRSQAQLNEIPHCRGLGEDAESEIEDFKDFLAQNKSELDIFELKDPNLEDFLNRTFWIKFVLVIFNSKKLTLASKNSLLTKIKFYNKTQHYFTLLCFIS